MLDLDYIVVGTGRCGTVYLARLLSALGIGCTHEAIFSHEGLERALDRLEGREEIKCSEISRRWSDWQPGSIRAEASYLAAPYLGHPCLSRSRVIHLVRNPFQVVFSFLNSMSYFADEASRRQLHPCEAFIYSKLPELDELASPLERACYYYVAWNRMIERSCQARGEPFLFHRIEDDPKPILGFLGMEGRPLPYLNKKANSIRSTRRADEDLANLPDGDIKANLCAIAAQYGYDLNPPALGKIHL